MAKQTVEEKTIVYDEVTNTRQVVNPKYAAAFANEGYSVEDIDAMLKAGKHIYTVDAEPYAGYYSPDASLAIMGYGLKSALYSARDDTIRVKPEDLYVTEEYTEKVPREVITTREIDVPDQSSYTPKIIYRNVGGNSANQTQSAATTTTQSGQQKQSADQNQRNDSNQNLSGQGNVALVVTPNAESAQQLESQAIGSASQTQQVEVASQADAASAMETQLSAVGASYHVAPVINIDASDRYSSEAHSTRNYQRSYDYQRATDLDGNTVTIIAVAALVVGYGVYRWWTSKDRLAHAAVSAGTTMPAAKRAARTARKGGKK